MVANQRVSMINSKETLLNNDYDFSKILRYLLDDTKGILFSDVSSKPEFDLDLDTGVVSAGTAILLIQRTATIPITNQKAYALFQTDDDVTVNVSVGRKIFIELENTLIQNPTLIEDTPPSTDYAKGLGIGTIKSETSYPSHGNYIKLWEIEAGPVAVDMRETPLVKGDLIDFSTLTKNIVTTGNITAAQMNADTVNAEDVNATQVTADAIELPGGDVQDQIDAIITGTDSLNGTAARAYETIAVGDAIAITPLYTQVAKDTVYTDFIQLATKGGDGTQAFTPSGFSFVVPAGETWTIKSVIIALRCRFTGGSGSVGVDYLGVTAKIFAALGTPGTNAVPTGSALYTSSNTIGGGHKTSYNYEKDTEHKFSFSSATLSAGNYIIQIDGTLRGPSDRIGTAFVYLITDDSNLIANSNVFLNTMADATKRAFFIIDTGVQYAHLASAANVRTGLAGYRGICVAGGDRGDTITYRKRGNVSISGVLQDDVMYLADTAGDIDDSAGTVEVLAGYGLANDTLRMGIPFERIEQSLSAGVVYWIPFDGFIFMQFQPWGEWQWNIYTLGTDPNEPYYKETPSTLRAAGSGSGASAYTHVTIPVSAGQYIWLTNTKMTSFTPKYIPNNDL